MQIEQLRYFIEVVEKGSINTACESLNMSQQALSQSMSSLEKYMGFDLLIRTNKGVISTEKGQDVYCAALDIINRWEQLWGKLHEELLSGTVCVSIASFLEEYYYTALLIFIRKYHLPLKIDVVNLLVDQAAEALEDGEIDLAAVCFSKYQDEIFMKQHPLLEFVPKKPIKQNILVSKYSNLAKKNMVTIEELKDCCFIIDKTEKERVDFYDKLRKLNPNITMIEVNSFYAKQRMIASNLGVALNVENGPIVGSYQDELVEVSLPDTENMISGILRVKEGPRKEFIDKLLKAW